MLNLLHPHPVGLPGLAAIGVGLVAFFVALFAAKARAEGAAPSAVARKAPITLLWIVLQGIAIGIAGFGRIDVTLDPLSPLALAEGTIVLVLMLGVVALFYAASRTMGKNWSIVARTREDHQLVQTGPFALVRHPIYVALFLFLLAMAVAYGHWRNLVVAVPLYWIATWLRVRQEERLLRDQFGAAYDAYAARVKRFVPGLI